jgi:predicted DNA-binding transcriptional regulator AlpA
MRGRAGRGKAVLKPSHRFNSGPESDETANLQPDNVSLPIPIAVRMKTAIHMTGLSRTKLYELIALGELDSAKIGATRLVVFASLEKLIDASRC